MKTMLILLAMLVAESAFADGYKPLTADEARKEVEKAPAYTPHIDLTSVNSEASKPAKVDYSIVTLPDGKTASVLTFK
jgi:hypothetical protein